MDETRQDEVEHIVLFCLFLLVVAIAGVVEIFGHDWSLDSGPAQADLGLKITALPDGLARTLAAL